MSVDVPKRMTVLCVDDEQRVLDGLRLSLRSAYNVLIASSGADALMLLSQNLGVAVIVSDMRMPGMDGAKFLAKSRELCPDATRILLTGETSREAAVLAINEGQIFRFLTKPCAPTKLLPTIEAAVRQFELVTAEKVLLQQTVLGSIRALTDILGLVNPIAFGRGGRIKRLATELAAAAGLPLRWELEAAALLSQVGYVSLPLELVEKAHSGAALSAEERFLMAESPKVAQALLARIPRLEGVAQMLARAQGSVDSGSSLPPSLADAAVVLRTILEFDALTSRGESVVTVIETLRSRFSAAEGKFLEFLAKLQAIQVAGPEIRSMRLRDVEPGMILMDDLRTDLGTLLVSGGYEVSESFVGKMRNFGPGLLAERVRVRVAVSTPRATMDA